MIKHPIDPSPPESARILVVARCCGWAGIARLPKGMQNAGFKVAALCYSAAYPAKTRYVNTLYICQKSDHTDEEFFQLMAP